MRATAGFFALTAAAFVYRWIVLGGIGGYVDRASGRPEILNIRPVALLKGFAHATEEDGVEVGLGRADVTAALERRSLIRPSR